MFVHDRKKIYGVLFALTMQFSAYGITSAKAKLYAGLFGLAGAAIGSKSDDPKIMMGMGLGFMGLAYCYLKKYTSSLVLGEISLRNNQISANQLAFSYKQIFESKSKEQFLQHIHEDYQDNLKEEDYSLISARNELLDLKALVKINLTTLKYIKADASKDGLAVLHTKLCDESDNYLINIKRAIARIITTEPEYSETVKNYRALQAMNAKLKIDQQNAISNAQIAAAESTKAQAQNKQAEAMKSVATLSWLEYWCPNKK